MRSYVLTARACFAALSISICHAAHAVEIPVSGTIGDVVVVDPGPDLIITPSLHLVARPWFVAYELTTGDFTPQILVSSTFLVNINTGSGKLFGEVHWEDPLNSGSGFRGPFTGDVSGAIAEGEGRFDGKWTLHGYGIYQGSTAVIDNYGTFSGEPQVYEGVIRVPEGLE